MARFSLLICLFVFIMCTSVVLAEVNEDQTLLVIDYIEDPENILKVQQVASAAFEDEYKPAPDNLHFGVTSSTYWVRIYLPNLPSEAFILELDNPTIESATLYYLSDNEIFSEVRSGAGMDFSSRENQSRNITFKIPPGIDTYYLSLKSQYPLQAPLTIYSEQGYLDKEARVFLFFMLYVAVISIIIVINLINFFLLKDTLYLYYCGAAFTMISGVAMISGMAFKYVWPDYPVMNLYMSPVLVFLSVFFIHGFARKLLLAKEFAPRADKVAYYIQLSALFLLVFPALNLLNFQILNDISAALNLASILTLTFIAVQAWRKKYKPAVIYLIGFTGLAAGSIIFSLGFFNIIHNPIGFFCISIGSTWEIIFFMAGMSLRSQVINNPGMTVVKEESQELFLNTKQELVLPGKTTDISIPDHIQQLSEREREVLLLISKGHTDKEIAEKLSISVATVKTHARNIYSKLLVSNRTEAVSVANSYQMI